MLCAIVAAELTVAAAGDAVETPLEPEPRDKSRYHLFNPTPRPLLRELKADRPDKTETAYTVDAGRVQLEMDLVSYTYDRYREGGEKVRIDALNIAPLNLKVGLLNNLDFQVMVEPYLHVRAEDRVVRTTDYRRGFGDVTLRLKQNLWGNDQGSTAMAVMPFVKIPTNQDELGNDAVESGVIVPFAVQLPKGWEMGVMTELDIFYSENDGDYHPVFVNTLTFSHNIVGNLAGYVEFFSEVSTEADAPWVGTVDFGFTYGLTENLQLDGGINIGVTRSAEDLNPFLGLTARF